MLTDQLLITQDIIINRLTAKLIGSAAPKTIAPLVDILMGGDIEVEYLPAALIIDNGGKPNAVGGHQATAAIDHQIWHVLIAVENGADASLVAGNLLTAVYNALIYDDDNIRWQPPPPLLYPFGFMGRSNTIYHKNYTTRELIFKTQLSLT